MAVTFFPSRICSSWMPVCVDATWAEKVGDACPWSIIRLPGPVTFWPGREQSNSVRSFFVAVVCLSLSRRDNNQIMATRKHILFQPLAFSIPAALPFRVVISATTTTIVVTQEGRERWIGLAPCL
jgi:hypothetical protein